ncbi:sensor histidine kinase [bacterium]|nr:sensor histidine kinase [bacterium]
MTERLQINVSWLLALRWAAVGGQLITLLFVWLVLKADVPKAPLLLLIGLTALTNLFFGSWYIWVDRNYLWREWTAVGYALVDIIMTLDILLLTGLLYLTGGAGNPFAVFYLVNLALAAVVVRSWLVWLIGSVCVVFFTILSIWYVPLPLVDPLTGKKGLSGILSLMDEGRLVAFIAASAAIAYFIARLTREVRDRDIELEAARQRESRNEKLEAMATLAAGAAHELATPLSTIAVVARELELHLRSSGASEESLADTTLIRTELAQCRTILDRMAGRAGESVGEGMTELTPSALIQEVLTGLPHADRVEVIFEDNGGVAMALPRVAIGQALRGLVKNAIDAVGREGQVSIRMTPARASVEIAIQDTGPGMPIEILRRVGEPFFTTKQPGEGTGLGIFLARAVLDRLGGSLELVSEVGVGTTARVVLPRARSRSTEDGTDGSAPVSSQYS